MKNRILKIMGIVMTIAMLASFMVIGSPVSAAGGPLVPSNNNFAGLVTPSVAYVGTDVILLEVDGNTIYGAIYEPATPLDTTNSYWVVKSVDGGYTWTDTTLNEAWYDSIIATVNPSLGAIVDIEVAASGNGTVYVAFGGNGTTFNSAKIYKIAAKGAGGITSLRDVVNEGDVFAKAIYDLDIYYDAAAHIDYVMVGSDIDALVIRDAGTLEEWIPLGLIDLDGVDNVIGNLDDYVGLGVFEVAFAPDFATSSIIWALFDTGNDITSTPARNVYGADDVVALAATTGNGIWNANFDPVVFDGADDIGSLITVGSAGATALDMAFPTNYSSADPYLYVALNNTASTGNLLLCVIDNAGPLAASETEALLTDPGLANYDVCSVEVYGDTIIAGAPDANFNNTYVSVNGGDTFVTVPVIGQTMVQVYMSDNFGTDATVWAATSGGNSGVSISKDGGMTYVQSGLIDFALTAVRDMAFGVNGDDKIAMLVTDNGTNASLWRTADVTALSPQWGRVLVDNIAAGGNITYNIEDVEVSLDGGTVMLYVQTTTTSGVYDIYKSNNGGFTFVDWRTLPAAVEIINDWIVEDGSTIYCATAGGFYGTSRFGPATTELATINLASVALSDNTVVVGTTSTTSVYVSFDNGENWGIAYAIPLGTGAAYVAFDANYGIDGADGEDLVYAATANGVAYQLQLTDSATDADKIIDTAVTGSLSDPIVDSTGAISNATAYNDIIVAEDNALYLSGTVPSGSTPVPTAANVSGTIQIKDDSAAGIIGDVVISSTAIQGIIPGHNFIDGEVILVIGDDLVVGGTTTQVSGTIQLKGVTSNATGYITLTNAAITNVIGTFALTDTVSINSSNLLCSVTGGGSLPGTAVGMQRLLLHETNVLDQLDNVWESETNASMVGLWYSNGSNLLWTIVGGNTVEVFEDFLSGKVMGVSAAEINASPNTTTKTVKVSFTQLRAATVYEIEAWDMDGAAPVLFSVTPYNVPLASRTAGTALSADVPGLKPLTKYNFYVRSVVNSANQSRWSSAVSVTTGAYLPAPLPISPVQGQPQVSTTSLSPTFTWASVSTAVSYDFQIGTDSSFATLIDSVNLATPGYTYTGGALAYDTDYYWRVRSVASDGTKSVWSSYGVGYVDAATSVPTFSYYLLGAPTSFHTMMDPEVVDGDVTLTVTQTETSVELTVTQPTYTIPVPEFTVTVPAAQTTVTTATLTVDIPDPATPVYIWIIVAIGALLTIAVIILIIRTRRVV
jgi:hypothetical protein